MTKKQLANIRKEFAELKGAGVIPVLMSFEEYLEMFDSTLSLKKVKKD